MREFLQSRHTRLREALPADFEAALLQTEASRFYLLDFDAGDAGTLLLLPDRAVYIIDSRYLESAEREVDCAEVVLQGDLYRQIADLCKEAGVQNIALETHITIEQLNKNREKMPGLSLSPSPALSREIERMRRIKDAEEIGRIRKAQAVTDDCFAHILPRIQEGAREIDLMLEMERFMRAGGAEQVAFETIFLGGANTSLPHGRPGEYRLKSGDLVTLDFGAKYKGYCSDMTRTVALGEPGERKRQVYDLVLRAHLAGMAAVQAGKTAADVDGVARKMIYEEGFEGRFGHGLGHSLGIEIHEEPRLAPGCRDLLESGMLVTVEPGIYLAGEFGCRIEDTVLVGPAGCEALPVSPKGLLVL